MVTETASPRPAVTGTATSTWIALVAPAETSSTPAGQVEQCMFTGATTQYGAPVEVFDCITVKESSSVPEF